eukprot:TRINITY_DN18285_c0_g1_i2.p1 TRINITY_DN18285_c0_g1~~TRINITY_DN18285_c0_g1_i2.p1  ORF type:complete len:337 (+),score=90.43 TRINITY_DN18285_c0_g1_i2:103-1113(+)
MAERTGNGPIVNLGDFKSLARAKLDHVDFDYYESGAEDEITLQRNRDAWKKLTIWPRFLVDVSAVDLSSSLLGIEMSMPLVVPPMAMQKLAHPDGEVGLARAAHAAGLIYCITQQATTKMETICSEAPGPKFFQFYMFKDRSLSETLIRRAEACGIKAIVMTVDSPVLGRRERDLRNKFTPQSRGVQLVNWTKPAAGNSAGSQPGSSAEAQSNATKAVQARTAGREDALSWADVGWLRKTTRLPIILKGLQHPADAALAVEHGCAAIWVSNHGGRQLDGGPPTADALPLVAAAVRGRIPIMVDGGLERGVDVLKALALGASVACIGRPLLWVRFST